MNTFKEIKTSMRFITNNKRRKLKRYNTWVQKYNIFYQKLFEIVQ